MCSVINPSIGQKSAHTQCEVNTKCAGIQILCRKYFDLLKLELKTAAVPMCSVTGSADPSAATCITESKQTHRGRDLDDAT
jgi:hypothetical protein